ncbi:MAG TPA: integrin alpha, partial [Candidatus Kapabacteria bacterium]|nr:integrin alpha [Candidatus Kapabacteria bacterium]
MMKKFIIGTVGLATIGGLVFTVPKLVEDNNTVTQEQQHNKEWFAKASQSIAESEYYIRFQEDVGAFQSVNRSNNYRVSYRENGFSIKPRTGNQEWVFDLSLKAIHKGEKSLAIANEAEMIAEKERMSVVHSNFDIEYVNTHEGMRQNFIVREQPSGTLPLTIELSENSELVAVESSTDDVLLLDKDNKPALWYKDLKVWDAKGNELPSYVSVNNETIRLIVDDENAVYPVTVDPISQTPDWSFESNQINAQLGFSVSGIGDVNGDNFEDFAIGAPYYDNGQSDEGAVFIFHGNAPSLPTTYTTMLESNQMGAMFGHSVSGAGRLNGDQFHDVVIGAPGYDNGQTDEGAIFVYLGSGIGVSTTAAAQRESNQANAQMGFSVASAGNINLDTFNDIIVGTPLWDNGQIDEGMVQVFFGGNTGLLSDEPISYESNNDGAQMGYSVSGNADINRDNRHDIIVGLPFYTNGSNKEGAVMMFFGQTTGGLSASPSWTHESNVVGYQIGYSVDIVGDVNGDGYADIVVGAPFAQSTLPNEGIVLAFYGNSSGLPTTPSWQVTGGQLNARFGFCVTGVGDVNNDGNDDVAIGAPLWDGGLED